MPNIDTLVAHYTHGALLRTILEGVQRLGKSPETVNVEDLGPVDEFHIGGRVATKSFLDQLDIAADDHVLDVGCGLGGASRFAAEQYGCRVTGIDLTLEYVKTGEVLCSWVGLGNRITLEQGDATTTPYAAGAFDKSYMMHVGMNIANKRALALEFFSQLQARAGTAGGPPPLGLHILMGDTAPAKVKNMIENIAQHRIAPVELVAERTA